MDSQQNTLLHSEDEGLDIKKYIFLILSHWWWFGISVFIGLTIAYLVNRYSQEIYSSSCSIIVGEEQSGSGTIEGVLDELTRLRNKKRKAVVDNEITILKSYSLARKTLNELDFDVTYTAVGRRNIAERQLYKEAPFVVVPDTSIGSHPMGTYNITILNEKNFLISIGDEFQQKVHFGELFTYGQTAFTLYKRQNKIIDDNLQIPLKYYFTFNHINALANHFSSALSVELNADKGTIVYLSLSGFVPTQICDYLNKLSEVYISSSLEEKNQASINTIDFIDDQLRGIVDSLEVTGLRLQKFRSDNQVIDISREGSFLFQKMQDLQSEKAVLDINSRYYRYLLDYMDNKKDFSDIVAPSVIGIGDDLLNKLVSQLNELNLQRRNLNLTIMENSPQLALVSNEIITTRTSLQENLGSLLTTNQIAMEELNERIIRIENEVQKLPGTERQLINIEREFTINDQIYTFLLEKRAEAGITKASNISNHKVLDIARPENSKLVAPNTSMNYMMGLIIGAGIPFLLLLVIDFMNTKITDRKYLESNLKAPIVGNIGHYEGFTDLPVSENPKSSLTESFRALRTNLQYILKNKQKGVIAVTSAISGEGKTFCSINIAGILAMGGKKVLLISLDLRRPKVHRIFNLENTEGMSTHLIGQTSYKDVISETNIKNLYVATSGPIPPNPAELVGSDTMQSFIAEAQKEFEMIIIDTPPVAIVSDTLILKDLLDSLIFVIRHDYSDKQVIEMANSMYEKHMIKQIGVVVNDIQLKGYYGYSYRYGYGYGYSYGNYYKQSYYDEDSNKKSIIEQIREIFS